MTGLCGGSQGRERKAMPNAVSSLESEIRAGAVFSTPPQGRPPGGGGASRNRQN
jgi:hypothetical protein